jgi:membrane associated rhomboid family serine protease
MVAAPALSVPSVHEWACIECGHIGPEKKCPSCGETTYDVEADRPFLEQIVEQRRQSRIMRVGGLCFFISMIPTVYWLRAGQSVFLAAFVLTTSVSTLVLRRRMPKAMRDFEYRVTHRVRSDRARDRRRLFLGAPALLAYALIAIHLASRGSLIERFGALPDDVREGRALWTLFTAGLLHINGYHLIVNCAGLILFGELIDLRLGRLRTLVIILLGSILGTSAHVLLTSHAEMRVVGISAGACALLGADLALYPRRMRMFAFRGVVLPLPAYVATPLSMALFSALDLLLHPQIAWLGHAGGFVSGLLIGLLMRRVPSNADVERVLERRDRFVGEQRSL